MKKLLLTLAVAASALLLHAQPQQTAENTLSIAAEGTAELQPDVIQATITLSGSVYDQNPQEIFGKLCDEALDELKIKATATLIAAPAGTANYNYGQPACNFFTRTYSVPLASTEEYEKLKATADKYKRNVLKVDCVLSFLGVRSETIGKYKIVAFENALKNAKEKSELAVKTLGGTLGPPVSIVETQNYNYNSLSSMNYKDMYYSQNKKVTIPYTYTISVKFLLK